MLPLIEWLSGNLWDTIQNTNRGQVEGGSGWTIGGAKSYRGAQKIAAKAQADKLTIDVTEDNGFEPPVTVRVTFEVLP